MSFNAKKLFLYVHIHIFHTGLICKEYEDIAKEK